MLTNSQEVQLGERIQRRRKILDALNGQPPNPQQQRIIDDGLRASQELVKHYQPLIGKTFKKLTGNKTFLTEEDRQDIWHDCLLTALKVAQTYDPWPNNNMQKPALFAIYLQSAITSTINTSTLRSSTIFSSTLPDLNRSLVSKVTSEHMEGVLRRKPTREELATATGGDATHNWVPMKAVVLHTDDAYTTPSVFDGYEVGGQDEWVTLCRALFDVLCWDVAKSVVAVLQTHNYGHRTCAAIAGETRFRMKDTSDVEQSLGAVLSHPSVRSKLRTRIQHYQNTSTK